MKRRLFMMALVLLMTSVAAIAQVTTNPQVHAMLQ